ncbi:MAG: hypothetical protein SGARI_005584, partial [Bacillariaceae sp.]
MRRNRDSPYLQGRSQDEGDVQPEFLGHTTLSPSQDSPSRQLNVSGSSGSGNCSSLSPASSKSSSSSSSSCEHHHKSSRRPPLLKSHSRAASRTFRVQRQESQDEELGTISSRIGEGKTPVKTSPPTTSAVSSTTHTEAEKHHHHHPYDDGDDDDDEVDFQKAVLYQNRIPIVSATEMNDVDFWSLDGSDQEIKGCCCRRRRRFMLLMTAVAASVVGVWLCIEYLAMPSYMAPPADNGSNENQQGAASHDKKDH